MTLPRIRVFELFAIFTFVAASGTATAEPQDALVVDPAGAEFPSLQAAVDAAEDGDTIVVRPGIYEEATSYNGADIGLVIDKSVTIVGVTGASDVPITDASAVAATIVSGAEAPWGTNFLVTAPDVTIQGLCFEAVAGSEDTSLPTGAINKAIEVHAGGFALEDSVVAAAAGFNFDGLTSTAVYFSDEEADDLESFAIRDSVLEGGITITNGAGDSADSEFVITGNTFSGSHFLRVRGRVDDVAWLIRQAGLPDTVLGNDLTAVTGFLLQSWDEDPARLPDRNFIRALLRGNETGPYAYVTTAEGHVRAVDYTEYGGTAPAVFVMRDASDLQPVGSGETLRAGTAAPTGPLLVDTAGAGFSSVQAAIAAAGAGDTIRVRAGVYPEQTTWKIWDIGLVIDKPVTILGVAGRGDEPIEDADAVQATIRSGVEAAFGANFLVTAPNVTIQGLRLEAVGRGNDPSLPEGAINKAFEVYVDGFTLAHSVVAAAEAYNYDGATSTAIYFGDEDPDDLESFNVHGNVLQGGITITNGAGDSGHARFSITDNVLLGTHFLRVRGRVDAVGWLERHAGVPSTVARNDLTGVTGYLLQSWDQDVERLADLDFVRALIENNGTGPYAYLTDAGGNVGTIEYQEYGGTAPAVFVVRSPDDLQPVPAGYTLHVGDTPDTDGDGTPDYLDDDIDGDGIANADEGDTDADGDGIPNRADDDSDNDGIADATEGATDTDGDGIPDYLDDDSDGDDITDATEGATDTDGDGVAGYLDSDSDGDGIADATEGTTDTDGDGIADYLDGDSDGDGIADAVEGDADSDGDLTPDYLDASIDEDADGIPDVIEGTLDADLDGRGAFRDTDSDGDGVPDTLELGDVKSDADGDGIADRFDGDATGGEDANGDGIDDAPLPDTDRDGVADLFDPDQDGDGIADFAESGAFGFDSDEDGVDDNWDADTLGSVDADSDGIADDAHLADNDADGIPNLRDIDSDRDGVADAAESRAPAPVAGKVRIAASPKAGATGPVADTDADGVPDYLDLDSDNDSIGDVTESGGLDVDGDGLLDEGGSIITAPLDSDLDGVPDMQDVDSNGDGVMDIAETPFAWLDADGDGHIDAKGNDVDQDGIPDVIDAEAGQQGSRPDNDTDGVPAKDDLDDDGDGLPDKLEGDGDADGDGAIDRLDRDADDDGIADRLEAGLPQASGLDADHDGVDDAYDAKASTDRDTDGDGTGDRLDDDSDGDGLKDAYEVGRIELVGADSDGDGIDDAIDVDATAGTDKNADGVDDSALEIADTDGDGLEDYRDPDSDNDGLADGVEDGDANGDGINDRLQKPPHENTGTGFQSGGGSVGWAGLLLLLAVCASRVSRRVHAGSSCRRAAAAAHPRA